MEDGGGGGRGGVAGRTLIGILMSVICGNANLNAVNILNKFKLFKKACDLLYSTY